MGNQISMGSMNFDSVKAGFPCPQRTVTELLHNFPNLIHPKFVWDFLKARAGNGGRSDRLASDESPAGLSSGVIDLGKYLASTIMNPFGQFRVAFYLTVIP